MYAAASKKINSLSRYTAQSAAATREPDHHMTLEIQSHGPPVQTPVVGSSENARNRYIGLHGTWRAQNLKKGSLR